MNVQTFPVIASSAALLLVIIGSLVIAAEPTKDAKATVGGEPQMQLPPGWTEADMKAAMEACTPGKMHEWIGKSVGTWSGKNTMWMYPGSAPVVSETTMNVTSI